MNVNVKISMCAAAVLLLSATSAMAQVKVVGTPFQPDLPVASAAVQGSTAVAPQTMASVGQSQAPATAVAQTEQSVASVSQFDVRADDKTIRDVLVRWTVVAGWTHKPEHWTIDRDLPVAGQADGSYFGTDFLDAARKLLSASEFTDRPVQPCFYANKVIRVVPKAELCDKTSQ